MIPLLFTIVSAYWIDYGHIIKCSSSSYYDQFNSLINYKGGLLLPFRSELYIECNSLENINVYFQDADSLIYVFLNNTNLHFINQKTTFYNITNSTFILSNNSIYEKIDSQKQFTSHVNTQLNLLKKADIMCSGYIQHNCVRCVNGYDCTECSSGYSLVRRSGCPVTCLHAPTQDYPTVCGLGNFYSYSNGYCDPQNCETSTGITSTYITCKTCKTCLTGYNLYNNKCYPQDSNCLVTNSYGVGCTYCRTNYRLVDRFCFPCTTIEGCLTCSSNADTWCTSCAEGYYLYQVSSISSCIACPIGCSSCATSSSAKPTCKGCSSGYYQIGSTCSKCDDTCGGTCEDTTGYCKSCINGYVFNIANPKVCISCQEYDPNCSECAGYANSCYKCSVGYPSVFGKCKECDSTCSDGKCDNNNGNCFECQIGYTQKSSASLSCEACNTAFSDCQKCSQTIRKCESCVDGKYPSTSSPFNCILCDTSCENNCNTTNGKCIKCKENYVFKLNDEMKCESCFSFDQNCLKCSEDFERKCITCSNGYYLSGGKCVRCDSSCNFQCDKITGNCLNCSSGYVPSNPISKTCQSCTSFDANCQTCSTQFERKCLICESSFYTSANGSCVKCDVTCNGECDGSSGNCTNCQVGYVFMEPKSVKCELCKTFDSNCRECKDYGERKCKTCENNYYPNPLTSKCRVCDSTCEKNQCDTSTGICNKCITNFIFQNPRSISCDNCSQFEEQCKTCSSDSTRKCVECKTNHYVNTENNKCKMCDS
ncbi:hypothetical protein EIN_450030, partial [Entamoeba invadens IP1]